MPYMNQFAIITDSAADLNQQMVEELDVTVLPLHFLIQGKEHEDWPDRRAMHPKKLYDLLRQGEPAKTSAVNTQDYVNAMIPLLDAGRDILVLAFSSGLSATCQSAQIAAEELRGKYPERTICVVDTLCASLGQGLLVWHASKLRAEGKTMEEVRDWVEAHKNKIAHWFTVNDLHHLKRGGRISAATALVGTMLSIKPVLHVDDKGHLVSMSKARGRAAALKALVDKMEETVIDPVNQPIFIGHGDCEEDANKVAAMIKKRFGAEVKVISYVGPVTGCHAGPGVIALFFMGREK